QPRPGPDATTQPGKFNIGTEVPTTSAKPPGGSEALTGSDAVLSVSSTLKPDTSSVQQGTTKAENEALTRPDGVVSVSATLKSETSSEQQGQPRPGPDATTQPGKFNIGTEVPTTSAKPPGGSEALTGSDAVLSVSSTLKPDTSSVQQGTTKAENEALTRPDGVVSVSATLKSETSSEQQGQPRPGPDATTQPGKFNIGTEVPTTSAKPPGGSEALTGSDAVLSVSSTLKPDTSSVQQGTTKAENEALTRPDGVVSVSATLKSETSSEQQ
ncbi:Uncharacterized protein DAT39_013707, partial [Clarias magur]